MAWLMLAGAASAQEVVILACNDGWTPGVGFAVSSFTQSEGAGLDVGELVHPQRECGEVVSLVLSAGFELRGAHSEYLGVPTYTFVHPAPARARGQRPTPRRDDESVAFVGCVPAWTTMTHVVRFRNSSSALPIHTGESSNCAEELATVMRSGHDLVHSGGGNHGFEAVLYTLHAGRRSFFAEANGFSAGGASVVATASLSCRQTRNGVDFVATFGESSAGGATIATGDDVGCASEVARLEAQGFEVLDVRVGDDAWSARMTFVRATGIAGANEATSRGSRKRRQRGKTDTDVDVVLLRCLVGRDGALTASVSAGLHPVSPQDTCPSKLSELLDAGFEILDVGDDRFSSFLFYTLARPRSRVHERERERR